MAEESQTGTPAEPAKEAPADQPASLDKIDDEKLDDHEVDDEGDVDDADSEELVAAGPRPLVFISYRHGSDQPIVSALKILLERAIAPRPEVFVASEGGIQPSTLGIKSQLQKAVQHASAVIGVITQASKDREWLYFEAGAAWGLEKLYAPLLVDTSATELSTTIADLPATNAHSQDQVRRMLDAIATASGARLRDRFGPKYASFARSFRPSAPALKRVDETTRGERDKIAEVVALHLAGKTAEADELIAKLETEAPDIEAKIWLRIRIIMDTKRSNFERLEQLEQLPVAYARSPSYLLWRATWETSSETALACLRGAIADPGSSNLVRRLATIDLAVRLYEVRRDTEATALLLTGLASTDRELRRDAAETWCNQRKTDSAILRMALAGFGVRAHPSSDLLTQQVRISIDEGWLPLAIYYAESADAVAKTGTTANDQGRAYAKASLWSLAYDAYQRAIVLGVSVARSNIGAIVGNHPVAAVGIQVLDQQQGAFDSALPASPYNIRAMLEQAIHDEKERRNRLNHNGELFNRLLVDLMELAIRSRAVAPRGVYMIDGQHFQSVQSAAEFVLTPVQPGTPVAGTGTTDVSVSVQASNVALTPMQSAAPVTGLGAFTAASLALTPNVVLTPAQQAVPVTEILAHAAALTAPKDKVVLRSICDCLPIWEATIKERKHLLTLDETGDLVGFSATDLAADDPDPRPIRFEGAGPS